MEKKQERYSYSYDDNEFYVFSECSQTENHKAGDEMVINKKPFKIKKPLLIAGIIAISLTIVAIMLATRKQREDLYAITFNRYCFETNFSGFNSMGVVTLELNTEEIESVAMEIIKKAVPQNGSTVDNLIMAEEFYREFESGLTITANQYENLIEGQLIEVTINADEDVLEELGICLKENKFKVQVQGLNKLADVDLFEHLMVELKENGEDGYTVELNYPDGRYEFYEEYFEASAENVYIDESFTVSFDDRWTEELAKIGIKVRKTEETYNVAELID